MNFVNSSNAGAPIAPLLLGLIVPLLIFINFPDMQANKEFPPACIALLVAFSAANWLVFGRTRLWIRYLVFAVVFFAGPFAMWRLSSGNSSEATMFSLMGFIAVLLNVLLFAFGFRVVKSIGSEQSNTLFKKLNTTDEVVFQYTILSICAVTFFIGITISAFLAWISIVGVYRHQVRDLYAEPIIVAIYVANTASLLAVLSKRRVLLWVIVGALVTNSICYFESPSQRDRMLCYASFLYFLFVAMFSILRIVGYHRIWKAPWRKWTKNKIVEPPIVGSAYSHDTSAVTRVENSPPPLPNHVPGVKDFAEPPVVVPQNAPPVSPESDELR